VKHLWLVRHGKAARDAPGGAGDEQRPLTERGRRDATALGRRLAAGTGVFGIDAPVPEVALCSAAVRTGQTAELVNRAMDDRLPVEAFRSLYGAVPETVLRYVREIDDGVRSALVVGHNPTMYELAWQLVGPAATPDDPEDGAGADDRSVLRSHGFPTCALAVVALDIVSWEECVEGCGSLAGVFSPPY